jgi:hypothetical protein
MKIVFTILLLLLISNTTLHYGQQIQISPVSSENQYVEPYLAVNGSSFKGNEVGSH